MASSKGDAVIMTILHRYEISAREADRLAALLGGRGEPTALAVDTEGRLSITMGMTTVVLGAIVETTVTEATRYPFEVVGNLVYDPATDTLS